MPAGQTSTAANRLPVHTDDDAVFNTLYVGGTSAPLPVASSSVGTSSLTSAVSSLSTVTSTNLSTGDSKAVSGSTVASTNLSNAVSRDTSQSTILSVTTSTANSG